MAGVKIACLAVLCMVVVVAPYAEAVTCGQVQGSLAQCLGYLRKGGPVPAPCCNGIRAINSAAKTPADRKQTCVCLQQAYKSITGISLPNAASLPGKCGVNIPYKISPSTDCSKINNRCAKFKSKPLEHVDLMERVYSGATATRKHA